MAFDLIPQRFLIGPSVWSRAPGLLCEIGGTTRSSPATLVARLRRTLPELNRHRALGAPGALGAADLATLAGAVADVLSSAIEADVGASRRVDPARVHLASPREDVARSLAASTRRVLDAADRRRSPPLAEVFTELVALWEGNPEAMLLARTARRERIPIAWPATPDWLVLGHGARRRAYFAHHVDGGGALAHAAGDKLACAAFLARAGFPTTTPIAVESAAEAVETAERLGYPVVVKASRAWAQVGVWAGLDSAVAVRHAFDRAAAAAGPLARPLLVERHRAGEYLRATLVDGRIAAVLHVRTPSVRADGVRSLDALARRQFRLAATDAWDARSLGVLDAVFSAQGWPTSALVPPRGVVVHLGYANQGPSVDVTDAIDPSLRRMLREVGRLLGLPVIGIDLLVAHPTGRFDPGRDVILEVNPNPAFAVHLHPGRGTSRDLSRPIVRALFPDGAAGARVPIVAGPPGCAPLLRTLAARLQRGGVRTAGYLAGASFSGGPSRRIARGAASVLLPTLDARADVLLFELDEEVASAVGVPFDRIDFLVGDVDARSGSLAKLLRSLAARSTKPSTVGAIAHALQRRLDGRRPVV